MSRTITVKGNGRISVKPDLITLTLILNGKSKVYEDAVQSTTKQLDTLKDNLTKIGFEEDCIKTASFNVRTEYDNVRDEKGNYNRVFSGFICTHNLKVEFDFDRELLSKAIGVIVSCMVEPELYIKFGVKDMSKVNEELLKLATLNAKKKAKILAKSGGVKLGELMSIDYNFGDINAVSRTAVSYDSASLGARKMMVNDVNINPEDITLEETAVFVWEIV